jgi:hypothetical protein
MIMLDRKEAGAPLNRPANEPTVTPTVDKGMGEEEIKIEDIPF